MVSPRDPDVHRLSAPPKKGQHDVTMWDGLEHLFAQPFFLAVGFGVVANELCPQAPRMVDLIACARR